MGKTIVAICYDFDSTLSTHEMQYWLAPKLDMTIGEFWSKQDKMKGVEFVLSYLWLTIDECRKKGITVTREFLQSCGADIEFYNGVKTWFKRLNEYALSKDIVLEHYIISTGNKEMIEGTSIFKEFKKIYGSEFLYNKSGEAFWPKFVVNGTTKTQYLFRINKGISGDDFMEAKVNERVEKKRVKFSNMIYIGDGVTDIPCMTMLKKEGGKSIGIYTADNKERVQQFLVEDRINYVCPANYRENSYLDRTVKLIIKTACLVSELQALEEKQTLKAEEKLAQKEGE